MTDHPSSSTSASHDHGHEYRPSKRRKADNPASSNFREVGIMREGEGLSSASFVGSASGIHFIRSVQGAVGANPVQTPGSNLVPGEDDRLHTDSAIGPVKPLWQPHELGGEEDAFSFNDLVDWTSSYFEIWHPCFPFLHAPSTLETFENLASQGLSSQPSHDLAIVRSLVSISIADRRQSDQRLQQPPPRGLVFSSFDDALEGLSFALSKPATISRLQAVLCVQLFLVSMLRLNGAARIGGLVNGLAFQIGLHRCPARYPTFSQAERQLRQRLFWSIYCIERYVCQALGLPLTIQDDDVDVCYPDRELHHHPERPIPEERTDEQTLEDNDKQEFDTRLKLLSLLARHAQIKGAIMELRNKNIPSRDESSDKAVLINARLTRWWNEVEDVFEQVDTGQLTLSKLHKVILTVSKLESRIALNRPLLATKKNTADYAAALHSCIGASKTVLSTLQTLLAPNTSAPEPIISTETIYAPLCWPSFTWATWMSAFIVMFGAAEREVSLDSAKRCMDRSLALLDRLAIRGSVWPGACAVAIKDLRIALTQRLSTKASAKSTSSYKATGSANQDNMTRSRQHHQADISKKSLEQTGGHQASPMAPQAGTTLRHQALNESDKTQTSPGLLRKHTGGLSMPQDVPTPDLYQSSTSAAPLQNADTQGNLFSHQAFDLATNIGSSDGSSRALWSNLERGAMMPVDVPAYQYNDIVDPFQGFDIPFWLGQDNYAGWLSENA